jgi:hypothetical protein
LSLAIWPASSEKFANCWPTKSGNQVGIWLLAPEHLRLGTWDLLCAWSQWRAKRSGRAWPCIWCTRRRSASAVCATDAHERRKDFLSESELTRLLEAMNQGRHGIRDHLLALMTYRQASS